jgi:hypothetical protein
MSTTPVLPRPSSPQSTMTARSGSASSALTGHRSAVRSNRSTVPTGLMYATKSIADAVDRSQPTLMPHRLQLPAQQRRPTVARTHRRPVFEGGEPMNPSNVNRKLAEEIEPRRYQTNASLSQPPTTGVDRPVRDYVTNVSWRVNQ